MEPFIIYSDHLLTMIQSDHFVDDGPNVLHLTLHHVPHLEELGLGLDEGPDPGGRPSEDDVPWMANPRSEVGRPLRLLL